MACQSWEAENAPKEMRGFLDIEDDEVKFFTPRFFILKEKKKVLEYYRNDPLVCVFSHHLYQVFYTVAEILFYYINLSLRFIPRWEL